MTGRRASPTAAVWLRLAVAVAVAVAAGAGEASAATLKADYQFQGTRASSVPGAPVLTDAGPGANAFQSDNVLGQSQQVLAFPMGNGLSLAPTTSIIGTSGFSVVMLARLDMTAGYRRLVDFTNGMVDTGFYEIDGTLKLYPNASGTAGTFVTAGAYAQIALTRDGSGTVVGYVNAMQVLGPYDDSSTGDARITAENVLRFFIDDMAVPNEDSAGAVARIRVYDGALSAAEIGALAPVSALPPVLGKQVTASVVQGQVLVQAPGSSGFVALSGSGSVPIGSLVDTSHGVVRLVSATGRGARTQSGDFSGGLFRVSQTRRTALTKLSLVATGSPACGAAGKARAARPTASSKVLRLLHAKVKGSFQTRGRYSAATVRGTEWDTIDRCDGTLTRVRRGSVVVTDFRARRKVTVRAGHSYLARSG